MEREPIINREELSEKDLVLAKLLKNHRENERFLASQIDKWYKQEKALLSQSEQSVKNVNILLEIRLAKIKYNAEFRGREVHNHLLRAYGDTVYGLNIGDDRDVYMKLIKQIVDLLKEYEYPDMESIKTEF